MKTQNKFRWFVVVTIMAVDLVLYTLAFLFWNQLTGEQKAMLLSLFKEEIACLYSAVVLLFTAFGFTVV